MTLDEALQSSTKLGHDDDGGALHGGRGRARSVSVVTHVMHSATAVSGERSVERRRRVS